MTLLELSQTYRDSAAALRERALLLEHGRKTEPRLDSPRLDGRIKMLRAMCREARELAALCEHYYERGYCRSGKYTL